ncbi:MAG TPA: hypothetical protein VGO76_16570 [Luteibacter sp.]|jgi:hypothetical protein|nr:hypothetical protein [Luteibacter sp.]
MHAGKVFGGLLIGILAFAPGVVMAADWTAQGRHVAAESYDRSAKGFYFTLFPGEDPVAAVRDCAQTMRKMGNLGAVSCFAYTSRQRFETRRGPTRICYSAVANWWGEDEPIRIQTVERLPRICPPR